MVSVSTIASEGGEKDRGTDQIPSLATDESSTTNIAQPVLSRSTFSDRGTNSGLEKKILDLCHVISKQSLLNVSFKDVHTTTTELARELKSANLNESLLLKTHDGLPPLISILMENLLSAERNLARDQTSELLWQLEQIFFDRMPTTDENPVPADLAVLATAITWSFPDTLGIKVPDKFKELSCSDTILPYKEKLASVLLPVWLIKRESNFRKELFNAPHLGERDLLARFQMLEDLGTANISLLITKLDDVQDRNLVSGLTCKPEVASTNMDNLTAIANLLDKHKSILSRSHVDQLTKLLIESESIAVKLVCLNILHGKDACLETKAVIKEPLTESQDKKIKGMVLSSIGLIGLVSAYMTAPTLQSIADSQFATHWISASIAFLLVGYYFIYSAKKHDQLKESISSL